MPSPIRFGFPRGETTSSHTGKSRHVDRHSEWREPRHDAFETRNAWSLFIALTESLMDGNLAELPKRIEALHGLLDTHVGLSA